METEKDDLLNDLKDSKKNKSKPQIIASIFILFIFGFIIMIILLIIQSRKISDLTNQINNLANQLDKQSKLFSQNLTHLNRTMNDNIDNLQKAIKHKDEEIKLLKYDSNNLNNEKLLIYNGINDIKNELIQNSKEIEICSNNFYLLNNEIKNNEIRINRSFAEIQYLKNLESNLAILFDFKIRIKVDFYINQQQAQLCSHKGEEYDIIDDSRIRLNVY